MKYIIIFVLGVLSASLFLGCEMENNTEKNISNLQKIQEPHTLTLNKINILDTLITTWLGKCHYEEFSDESYQAELVFNQDLSFVYTEKIYPTQNCTGDYYNEQNKDIGSYKLGNITKGSDGKTAYDFETHTVQDTNINDEYFMLRFTSSNLIFTDENIDNSQPNGDTAQTRNNYFNDTPRIIFAKKL